MPEARCAAKSALFITKTSSHHFEASSSLRDSLITSVAPARAAPPTDLGTNGIFVTDHMYLMIILMINKKSMNLRIMMNCDVIKNFIFQLKMKKLNIKEFYASMSKFKIFDDITLRTYSSYTLLIKIVDQTNYVNFDRHDFITTNMMSIKLILKLF